MIRLKDVLNGISLIFTTFLVLYRFVEGYDFVELSVYNLYFFNRNNNTNN